MGYILPINHYQYQDYQVRTTQKERSPFALDKVFKASLNSKLKQDHPREHDLLDEQRMSGLYTPASFYAKPANENGNYEKGPHREDIYSEVTGKGRNFSETI